MGPGKGFQDPCLRVVPQALNTQKRRLASCEAGTLKIVQKSGTPAADCHQTASFNKSEHSDPLLLRMAGHACLLFGSHLASFRLPQPCDRRILA